MRIRILETNNHYIPQYRQFLIWKKFCDEKGKPITFTTFAEALSFLFKKKEKYIEKYERVAYGDYM